MKSRVLSAVLLLCFLAVLIPATALDARAVPVYEIKVTCEGMGNAYPSGTTAVEGGSISIKMVAKPGYELFEYRLDGETMPMSRLSIYEEEAGTEYYLRLTDVRSDHLIEATFKAPPSLDNFTYDAATYKGFPDVDESLWYGTKKQAVVKTAVELGIMQGDGTNFNPEASISVAEAVKMACMIHVIYYGDENHEFNGYYRYWYEPYFEYAIEKGIITDKYTDYASKNYIKVMATRAELAGILAGALPAEELPHKSSYVNEFIPDVIASDEYATEIYLLYYAGVVQGDENGNFNGGDTVTRAAAAAMVIRICIEAKRV